jgi:hypothetical protein
VITSGGAKRSVKQWVSFTSTARFANRRMIDVEKLSYSEIEERGD